MDFMESVAYLRPWVNCEVNGEIIVGLHNYSNYMNSKYVWRISFIRDRLSTCYFRRLDHRP
jgi:hypothetical protein